MRDEMNMDLGDALNLIEKSLSANQAHREVLLDDAVGVIRNVITRESEDENV